MLNKIIAETSERIESIRMIYQHTIWLKVEKDQFSIAAIGNDNYAHILSVIINKPKKEIYIQEKTEFSEPIICRMYYDPSVKPDDPSLYNYFANRIADHLITEIKKRNAMNTRVKIYQHIEKITKKVFRQLKNEKGELKISIKDPFGKGIIYECEENEYRFWLDWDGEEDIELIIIKNNHAIKKEFIENFNHPDSIEKIKTIIQEQINRVEQEQ